jgi:hypothetical protein
MNNIAWVLIIAGAISGLIGIVGTAESVVKEDRKLFFCSISLLISCIIMISSGTYIINSCECVAPRKCSCGYAYTYEDEISYCPDCGAKLEGYPRTNEDK